MLVLGNETVRKKYSKGKAKLTEEHIRIAESNGISKATLYQRFYNRRWPIQKAISKPVNKRK